MIDWRAKWIWAREHLDTPNLYLYARREFEADGVSAAALRVACSGGYKLHINGRCLGRGAGQLASRTYDEYDVTHVIRRGRNVVAVLCHSQCAVSPGGLLLQLEAANGNGGSFVLGTDDTWKVKPADDWDSGSARMSPAMGFQEVYDSRRKPVGWNVVGFDDSEWQAPEIIGEAGVEPWPDLAPREIPRLREREAYPDCLISCGTVEAVNDASLDVATRMSREPRTTSTDAVRYANSVLCSSPEAAVISPGQPTYMAIDFGKEVVGFPTLRIRDGGQGIIDIGCSEALDGHGDVDPTRQGILQADRLILHGGRQEWQTFGRRAFRYVQLTFRDLSKPLHIESVSVSAVGYPADLVSTFECSDDLLNRIWRAGVYTLSLCMQEDYESGPLVGQASHPADIRLQALMNYYSFFDTKLVAKALKRPPETGALAWAALLYDYYQHTGDRALVERLYPTVRSIATAHEECDSVARGALHYRALRDAAKLASAVGEVEDSVAFHDRAERVFGLFNECFWDDEASAYVDGGSDGRAGLQANAMAVVVGLADTHRSELIASLLKSSTLDRWAGELTSGFDVLQAMARLGLDTEALDFVRSIWGGMLQRGATTWWETFDPGWPEGAVSPDGLCRGSSGAPTWFLPAEVLGVKPSMPESSVVVVQPRVGDLEWAKGRIAVHGQVVEVEWRREPDSFTMNINAPEGFIAALPVRGFTNPRIEELDMSPDTPDRRARKTYGWGNVIWHSGEEHDPYLDWLYSQDEEPPEHYVSRSRCSYEGDYIWVRECIYTQVRYQITESA